MNSFVKENLIKSKLSTLEKVGLGLGIIEKKSVGGAGGPFESGVGSWAFSIGSWPNSPLTTPKP